MQKQNFSEIKFAFEKKKHIDKKLYDAYLMI